MDYRECINKDTLNYFARTNEKVLTGPIRGVVLEFPGLGGGSCMGGVDAVGEYTAAYGLRCGRENILLAYVFTGPWSWMNDSAVKITDAVVDAIWERYGLTMMSVGARGMIGKGARLPEVVDAMKKYNGVYFGAIGGAGALLAKCIKEAELIAFEDLGAEALRKLYVEDMPVVVIIDSEGNNLYEEGRKAYLDSKK